MELTACLNGTRTPLDHPAVPVTPAAIALEAAAAVAAGARAVHVHPRDGGGRESLAASDVGAAVAAVRASVPGIGVGVTTGLWITDGDPARRADLVAGWGRLPASARPDAASCNCSEAGWAQLWPVLRDAGVGVEAGVWTPEDADRFARSGLAGSTSRVLLEVMDVPAGRAQERAVELLELLAGLAPDLPRLLHGEGGAAWPVLATARERGVPSRIGLEDVLHGPKGEPVAGNADLVRLALAADDGPGPLRR